ncbi:MAG: hypothetical protein J5I92_15600 [Thiogranum sp.]|nr:hypothetical protein [Thiogranum sp.]
MIEVLAALAAGVLIGAALVALWVGLRALVALARRMDATAEAVEDTLRYCEQSNARISEMERTKRGAGAEG